MQVYFIADPHLGHTNINKFRWINEPFTNDDLILRHWRMLPKKSLIYVLGDVAFNDKSLLQLVDMPGRKILISGNHDDMTSQGAQREVFESVYGFLRYKGMWVSHAPVHPDTILQSRCFVNIHGHTHKDQPSSDLYFSVDPEVLMSKGLKPFVTLEKMQEHIKGYIPNTQKEL